MRLGRPGRRSRCGVSFGFGFGLDADLPLSLRTGCGLSAGDLDLALSGGLRGLLLTGFFARLLLLLSLSASGVLRLTLGRERLLLNLRLASGVLRRLLLTALGDRLSPGRRHLVLLLRQLSCLRLSLGVVSRLLTPRRLDRGLLSRRRGGA